MPQRAIEFAADDKVLFLGIPEAAVIRDAAVRLARGLLVAIDDAEKVRASRREFRDLANAMFVPATPDEIPWQDGFFTRVIDTRRGNWPNPGRVAEEMTRVASKPRE